ncbi:hypothetical protein [Gloeothece verrucosa]|uniref:CRISPR type III-B/RAMP module-associated protein Cmr5 n=1 Tax=Gloeothece verrucosa (strain PCC 7822) TaxID=497965 RepID=E0UMM5_GLOV7|nr:hypothetical protein [Gloeothece verrucosa]ADN18205.1 conserved hypothetical protein [Gloeothece verrucosa PCC 7822]
MTVQVFDPRALAEPVYDTLSKLRQEYDKALANNIINKEQRDSHLKEQKNQAVELYTYLATWGLMRLKAEELALNKKNLNSNSSIKERVETSQYGKLEVVREFFECLKKLIPDSENKLELRNLSKMDVDEYLGIMGLGLAIAQEFSFWATAIYYDIKGDE